MGARVVLMLAVLALAGCGSSGPHRTAVVVDTDLGSDDVVALLYVAQDRGVDLRAVTVSGTGLVHCPEGARIALDLLALAGRRDVPVACGAPAPLAGGNAVPDDWRAAADGRFGLTVPPSPRRADPDAARLLRDAIERAPSKPTVLALGPMTNLAAALRARPSLARDVGRVVAMAGAVDVPGNVDGHAAAETNAWIDPLAARVVLRSGAPVTLVPLDATNQVPVTPSLAAALARYRYATPAATLASDTLTASGAGNGGAYLWDELAAVAAIEPGLVRTALRRLDIATAGADAGRTAPAAGSAGAPVSVAAGVDRRRVERELLGTLLGGAPFAIPAPRADGALTLDAGGCAYRGARSLTAGRVVLDTVNRSASPFEYVAGRLDADHTVADLARFARRVTAGAEPPSWFTVDATGWTPPHSTMTWVANLPAGTTGETVLACVRAVPPRAWLAARLPVYAHS